MSSSVPSPCLVLIAPSEHIPTLQKYVPANPGELLTFSDTEPLQALEVITRRRPMLVALERLFAGTPRGSALIGRIKSDQSLAHAQIVIVAHDDEESLNALRRGAAAVQPPPAPATDTPPPVDFRGTRRAVRIRIAEHVTAMVDGHMATLVDLSTLGAQVLSPTVLRPNHRVRVVMADDRASVKCAAVVAWASFEIPPKVAPRYRAGLQFLDAAPSDVAAYCDRHKQHQEIED